MNETFHLGFWGNIYEGLIRRGPNLEIEPALAERWEVMEPTRWRFYLRKGVKFRDGTPFTADDVVFSATRVRHPDSDLRVRISADTKVVKVDDHTVDFVTEAPNPILPNEWSTWYIMSKSWTEKNNAVTPQSATKKRGKLCHPPCQRHRAFYIGQSRTGCKNRLQSQSGLVG